MKTFNAEQVKNELIQWIRDYFTNTATPTTKAIIGISGGKDSTIVAKLCAEAIGSDRVIGVFLPYGDQDNLQLSGEIASYLNIETFTIQIQGMAEAIRNEVSFAPSNQSEVNLLPRLRMTSLYFVSQSMGGRVSNNCNLSETVMGFATQWGDNTGDFSPLSKLTVHEVCEVGIALGLPYEWVYRVPQDDLNKTDDGKIISDEDVMGISYEDIDLMIASGEASTVEAQDLFVKKYNQSLFKRPNIASFDPELKRAFGK